MRFGLSLLSLPMLLHLAYTAPQPVAAPVPVDTAVTVGTCPAVNLKCCNAVGPVSALVGQLGLLALLLQGLTAPIGLNCAAREFSSFILPQCNVAAYSIRRYTVTAGGLCSTTAACCTGGNFLVCGPSPMRLLRSPSERNEEKC